MADDLESVTVEELPTKEWLESVGTRVGSVAFNISYEIDVGNGFQIYYTLAADGSMRIHRYNDVTDKHGPPDVSIIVGYDLPKSRLVALCLAFGKDILKG